MDRRDGFSCARTRAGGVCCWGVNGEGQLGRGTQGSNYLGVSDGGLASPWPVRAELP